MKKYANERNLGYVWGSKKVERHAKPTIYIRTALLVMVMAVMVMNANKRTFTLTQYNQSHSGDTARILQ